MQMSSLKHKLIGLQYVYVTDTRYVIDPDETIALIDENTIGICAIVGTTYTGEYEDVKRINDLLVEKNIDVPIHGMFQLNGQRATQNTAYFERLQIEIKNILS